MATLKISGLSVGDWVMCNGFKATIAGYNAESGSIQVLTRQKNKMWFGIDDIQPIPIKAEILEKNGFTRSSVEFPIYEYTTLLGKMLRKTVVNLNHPYCYIACRIEDTGKELHELDRVHVCSSVDRNPIHIHDLQRVLRLAGIEKEINL